MIFFQWKKKKERQEGRRRKKKKKFRRCLLFPLLLLTSVFFLSCFLFGLFGCSSAFSDWLVVLVRSVRQTVPSQVTVAPKHLSAAVTAVGLDVCMGEKVSFQVTSLIKGSSACGAFVRRFLFRFKASKGLFPLVYLDKYMYCIII